MRELDYQRLLSHIKWEDSVEGQFKDKELATIQSAIILHALDLANEFSSELDIHKLDTSVRNLQVFTSLDDFSSFLVENIEQTNCVKYPSVLKRFYQAIGGWLLFNSSGSYLPTTKNADGEHLPVIFVRNNFKRDTTIIEEVDHATRHIMDLISDVDRGKYKIDRIIGVTSSVGILTSFTITFILKGTNNLNDFNSTILLGTAAASLGGQIYSAISYHNASIEKQANVEKIKFKVTK